MTDSRRWKGLPTHDLGDDEWLLDPVYQAPDWLAPGSWEYQEVVVESERVWEGRRARICVL